MNKVALFDFCETIANFQTADAYVDYIREQTKNCEMLMKDNFRILLRKTKILGILEKLFPKSSINKRLVLWQLKGLEKQLLERYAEEYYINIIKPNFIVVIIEKLRELQNEGWRIVLVSAGYEIYLKYFARDFNIREEDIIAVKIKFNHNICNGTFDGGDRLWDKTEKLNSKIDKDKVFSIAFSDSISDLPMLNWVNKGYVVRRRDKEKWSNNYNFEEILWM